MIQLQEKLITNTWLKADWETYINTIESPEHEKHQGYYYNGHMRIEDMPTGADHSRYHLLVANAINLFCTLGGLQLMGLIIVAIVKLESENANPIYLITVEKEQD